MAWPEGVEEPRLLLAPESCALGSGADSLLSLRQPKTGTKTSYLFMDDSVLELHWFKQSHGSWFLGDYVCEDGSLYASTPVDPVFLLLPLFEEARMKKHDNPGMFRSLDEILFVNDYPGYQQMLSMADTCMEVVCEVKEVGSSRVFRLSDEKVLAWLCYKVSLLTQALQSLDQNYTAQNEKNTVTDAVSILGEYLKDEPWMKVLCNHLRVSLDERSSDNGGSQVRRGSDLGSPVGLQNADKKTEQAKKLKKVKVETGSRNIRDMFSRVTRSRKN